MEIKRNYNVEHMSYSQIRKSVTPKEYSEKLVNKLQNSGMTQQEICDALLEKHGTVFQGIGKHKYRKIKLDIDPKVKPVIQAARRTALPIRAKADKMIDKYEEEGIVESVDGPIDWLANPVYTPKADADDIRMNIDMTDANRAIKRHRHVIPTLEELRHDFNEAKYYSVLDQKCGYN